ncbi:hypothetical protein E2C01_008022 [Portunus trituberculatus]|uniref:Uncharacterized protein n=1 Tax=Portunus trituberculatus TaxID=210409 RepID=A0A5B7CZP1_PORTR|nr:hypothetical protein [Portunus trituberculatus]
MTLRRNGRWWSNCAGAGSGNIVGHGGGCGSSMDWLHLMNLDVGQLRDHRPYLLSSRPMWVAATSTPALYARLGFHITWAPLSTAVELDVAKRSASTAIVVVVVVVVVVVAAAVVVVVVVEAVVVEAVEVVEAVWIVVVAPG